MKKKTKKKLKPHLSQSGGMAFTRYDREAFELKRLKETKAPSGQYQPERLHRHFQPEAPSPAQP